MTEDKKRKWVKKHPKELAGRTLSAEIRKDKRRSVLVVQGVLGVGAFSSREIGLTSHGGRLTVRGEGLTMTVFENRTVEVFGKISGVELGYVKN